MKRGSRIVVALAGLWLIACGPNLQKSSPPGGGLTLVKAWETKAVFKAPESALYDTTRGVIYVSNVNGAALEKNGLGFLSKLSPDGAVLELQWVKGLDAPKGMAIRGDKLYVADIDTLVEVDLKTTAISNRYHAAGARFLNDVAADMHGYVYASALLTNSIYRLGKDRFEKWIESAELENPNGLLGEGHRVVVASWGACDDSLETTVPGHLKAVSKFDKTIQDIGDGSPLGNLDGLETDGGGGYFVSDWKTGKIYHIDRDGKPTAVLTLKKGTADIEFIGARKLLVIPLMEDNKIVAYRVGRTRSAHSSATR